MTRIEQWKKCPNSGKLVVGPNCLQRLPQSLWDAGHFTADSEFYEGKYWVVLRGPCWNHHVPKDGVLVLSWEESS